MINKISFKNYKAFKTEQKLEIKPLTILVGPNNSGKSSITNLLALLKQSVSGNYEPSSFLVFNEKEGVTGSVQRLINYKTMREGESNRSKPMLIRLDYNDVFWLDALEYDKAMIMSREDTYEKDYRYYNINDAVGSLPEWVDEPDPKDSIWSGDRRLRSRLNEIFELFDETEDENITSSIELRILAVKHNSSKQKLKFINGVIDGYEVEMHNTSGLTRNDYLWKLINPKNNLVNINVPKKHQKKLYDFNYHLMKDIFSVFGKGSSFECSPNFLKNIKSIKKFISEITFDGLTLNGDGILNYGKGNQYFEDTAYYEEETQRSYSLDGSKEPFYKIPEYLEFFVQSNRKNKADNPQSVQEFTLKIDRNWARDNENPHKQKYNYDHKKVIEYYLVSLLTLRIVIDRIRRESQGRKLTSVEEKILLSCIENFLYHNQVPAIRVVHHNTVKKIIKNYNYHTDSYFNSFNFIDIRENLSVSDFDREQLIKFIGEPAFLFTDGIFHPIDKKDLLNSVNDDLKSIGLKYKLIIESFSPPSVPNRAKRFIVLLENHDGQRFGLDEMGYGITQLIPLLIRKNYFSINQTVAQSSITVIREPEANIHPALQANLAQNLLSTISKGRYNNNNSIIVETHSEHFIRGVQIAIAKGDIKSTDVNILYVNQSPSGNSSLKKIELEEKGHFKSDYPKGFFESGFKEVVELQKLQRS